MKKEYIWKIYTDKNDHYHCERFPIVYQNKEIIYYKSADTYYLHSVSRCSLSEYSNTLQRGYYSTEPPTHIRDLLSDQTAQEIERLKCEIRRYKSYVRDAERTLSTYRNALCIREEELAELEGMKNS